MEDFDSHDDETEFGDVLGLLAEKNRKIRSQEKDIASLKRELAVMKDQLNCFLDGRK